jgi:hypothetical protein
MRGRQLLVVSQDVGEQVTPLLESCHHRADREAVWCQSLSSGASHSIGADTGASAAARYFLVRRPASTRLAAGQLARNSRSAVFHSSAWLTLQPCGPSAMTCRLLCGIAAWVRLPDPL